MNRNDFEILAVKHKEFEAPWEQRLAKGLPVVARMDGRAFRTFTQGLERPYDAKLALCMQKTAEYLVSQSHADIAYRQSDEITLGWKNDTHENAIMFDGRVVKLATLLASIATVMFNRMLAEHLPAFAEKMPVFDARVWQYPSLDLAAEAFLWRETDAMRNSVTMMAHAKLGDKAIHKKGIGEKLAMLEAGGHRWRDMPEVFRRGVYLRKETVMKHLTEAELARIPEKFRPTGPVPRSVIEPMTLPLLETIPNLGEVLFLRAEPGQRASEWLAESFSRGAQSLDEAAHSARTMAASLAKNGQLLTAPARA